MPAAEGELVGSISPRAITATTHDRASQFIPVFRSVRSNELEGLNCSRVARCELPSGDELQDGSDQLRRSRTARRGPTAPSRTSSPLVGWAARQQRLEDDASGLQAALLVAGRSESGASMGVAATRSTLTANPAKAGPHTADLTSASAARGEASNRTATASPWPEGDVPSSTLAPMRDANSRTIGRPRPLPAESPPSMR